MKETIKNYYLKSSPVYGLNKPCVGKNELTIAAELAAIVGGRTEVQAGYGLGRIDILSNEWLIEAKYGGSTNEKNALGQVLVYAQSMKWQGKLGLAIISDKYPHPGIIKFCKDNFISIFHYNLNTYKWSLLYENVQ